MQIFESLGIVAQKSRSNQKMLREPPRLTVPFVFTKLVAIAKTSGKDVNFYCIFIFLLIFRQ